MRLVIGLGGNALLQRGESFDMATQRENAARAARPLAALARDHQVVVTHGNGPQVGMLALESAHDPAISRPYPFDVLGAQTQGMIGYWLVQALQNALPGRQVTCLISRFRSFSSNAGRNASISYNVRPSEYTSLRASVLPSNASGGM